MTEPFFDTEIEFLRNAAKSLRALAAQAPDIAEDLNRLADKADAQADLLERKRDASREP